MAGSNEFVVGVLFSIQVPDNFAHVQDRCKILVAHFWKRLKRGNATERDSSVDVPFDCQDEARLAKAHG